MSQYVYQSLSGEKLTKTDFTKYIEKKVAKTISQFNLIERDDIVTVAVSGGKDSLVLLHILSKFQKKHGFKLNAILIDEGIAGYRDKTIPKAQSVCNDNEVELHIYSYKDNFGQPLDNIVKDGFHPCSVCGVFRRKLLNKHARELKSTKLATGHNLDDEAQAILMNQLKHNLELSARMGPITGLQQDKLFVPRIKPLYMITEKEVMIYAFLHDLTDDFTECPYVNESFRKDVQEMLNNLEDKHPGAKQGLVKSFLDNLPLLRDKYRSTRSIQTCNECGEPCIGESCNACKMQQKITK